MAQQQPPHVPKFGDWESDNDVPYTVFFENARKKGNHGPGVKMMNPNDPEENPEAFMLPRKGNESESSDKFVPAVEKQQKGHTRNNSRSTVTSDSDSSQSNHRGRSHRKKSVTGSSDHFVPRPSTGRHRNASNVSDSDVLYGTASVPKFGAWDEKDPKSGEGFTVIFNKVKEEKQIAAFKFPVVPPQVGNHTNSQEKVTKSKKWCWLCSRGSD